MMSGVGKLVVVAAVAFVIFAAVAKADLQCYECIPTPTKKCEDNSMYAEVDCQGEYCRKIVQNVQGEVSYVLQCGTAEGGMDKPHYTTANDYVKVFMVYSMPAKGGTRGKL